MPVLLYFVIFFVFIFLTVQFKTFEICDQFFLMVTRLLYKKKKNKNKKEIKFSFKFSFKVLFFSYQYRLLMPEEELYSPKHILQNTCTFFRSINLSILPFFALLAIDLILTKKTETFRNICDNRCQHNA